MTAKIGISPIAWQNDDLPDLTADYSMDQALREAREIGYIGVERGRRMPQDTEGLGRYLAAHAMALCGGWCSGNLMRNTVEEEIEVIRQQVEQFVALGAPCIVYAECSNTVQGQRHVPVSQRPKLSRAEVESFARKLGELAKWTVDQGLPLAYHHHMGSMIEDMDDISWLMDAAPMEVSLCFDTGHLLFAGGDVLAGLGRWGERSLHVHFKDIRPEFVSNARAKNKSFLEAVIDGAFTVPGDGCIDFQAVADYLKNIGYDGWIVVEAEQDPAKANPHDYSKAGYQHILEVCAKAGLEIAPTA